MVHNGIEYGVMQLLAETYDLMKRGLGLNDDELHEVYVLWNKGEPNGYLVEISSHIFSKQDEKTGQRLIDDNPFFPRPPVRPPALSTAFTSKAIS